MGVRVRVGVRDRDRGLRLGIGIGEAVDTGEECEPELDVVAVGGEGTHCVVEAGGEGARRRVLRHCRPADDSDGGQVGDDLEAELGSLAAVEADALQPRRQLRPQQLDDLPRKHGAK